MKPHYVQSSSGEKLGNAALSVYDNLPIDERNVIMRQAKRLDKQFRNVGQYSAIEFLACLGAWAVENGVDLVAEQAKRVRVK